MRFFFSRFDSLSQIGCHFKVCCFLSFEEIVVKERLSPKHGIVHKTDPSTFDKTYWSYLQFLDTFLLDASAHDDFSIYIYSKR